MIFGAWDVHKKGDRALIFDEKWERNNDGRRNSAYKQSLEHIRLVETGGYTLKTYQMIFSDERRDEEGNGPAKIEDFIPKLETKTLERVGTQWFAVDRVS